MRRWLLAISLLLAACPGTRAPRPTASCPEAARLLGESAEAREAGALFRALAHAEAADRACASEPARRAVAGLREELWGRPGDPPPAAADAAEVHGAALLRLAGEPAQALAKLRPIAARLDAAGLAELSRVEAASHHAAAARAALEKAAARAEQQHGSRGRWRWQKSSFEKIVRLAFTPDGTKLVSADREGWIRIWEVAGGHELVSIRSGGWPNSLEISPDGRWIASARGNGPVEVWDVSTGQRALEIANDAPAVFAPDGHLLMATSKHEGILEVELPSGRVVAKLAAGWPRNIEIGRDRIYTTDEDTARRPVLGVWERGGTHRKLDERVLPAHASALAVTPRGELVLLFHDKIVLQDARGKVRHTFPGAHATIALTPDGKRLVASATGRVNVFDLGSGQLVRHTELGPEWVALAVHPRGTLLATAGAEGISIASLASGERTARFGRPHAALSLAFEAGGRRLAVGAASGTATIWDLAGGGLTAVTPRAGAPVTAVAFGPGGLLATGSAPPSSRSLGRQGGQATPNSTLAVWDASGARRWSKDLEQLVWLGYRPGGDTLATASTIPQPNGTGIGLTMWDAKGAPLQTLGHESRAAFAWSTDGTRLAYAGDDGLVLAPTDGSRAAVLDAGAEHAAFQPGGGLLALADDAGRILLWDAAAGRLERVLLDEAGGATALAWAPGGGVLASAAGKTVQLWDPRAGGRLAVLDAHAAVTSIAFRPDGRSLAVACDDGLVELWSIADAARVVMLAMPGDARGIAFAPDGAVDGTLADDDPLFWTIGDVVLPGRAVWDREAAAGLLPARLAKLPAETAPRAGLAGAAPPPVPPACFTPPAGDDDASLISASAPDDRSLSLCVAVVSYSAGRRPRLPTCFVADLASGAYRPRAPTPREALGKPELPSITVKLAGKQVAVCRAGACRELTVPELTATDDMNASPAVNEAGTLVAVITDQGEMDGEPTAASSGHAVIYDVATGRRLRRLAIGNAQASVDFIGDTLLVSNTPCAGPCSSSRLVDPRTGRRLAAVGGATAFNTSELTPARVAGNVYAFNDWDSPAIVYQDIKTGRVVRRFVRPDSDCNGAASGGDCGARMMHAGNGIAILGGSRNPGDLTLLDARGKVVARHRMPVCTP